MAPVVAIVFGGIVSIYLVLRLILHVTQDAKEPPAVLAEIPFVGAMMGMIREKSQFYLRMRDLYKLPIYTLRLPFFRIYIVNATELIPAVQKQWRTISFASIAADAGTVVGMSKVALKVMRKDLMDEEGFSLSWPRFILPSMSPGEDLDAINRKAIEVVASRTKTQTAEGTIKSGLWDWTRHTMIAATTEAIYGPENPYRDAAVTEAWKVFEAGFLNLAIFPLPSLFSSKLFQARELAATAMISYMRKGGYKEASGLVRKRFEHHRHRFGLEIDDIARGELGNTFAVLGSSTPCALWLLYHIFSDTQVLADIREELSKLVEDRDGVSSIDLADISTSCPILLSTFQETLRYRAVNAGARVILEDVLLDNRVLLKKGSLLMVPAPVQHTSVPAWGENADTFDYMRFMRKHGQKPSKRAAFRAFGGGHILCPGRHFASTEIMSLAAILVLQFDVKPTAAGWQEPTWNNTPVQAGFPIPDVDIEVEFQPRDPTKNWDVRYSSLNEALGIVSEDIKVEDRESP